jgi:hypothetical protein
VSAVFLNSAYKPLSVTELRTFPPVPDQHEQRVLAAEACMAAALHIAVTSVLHLHPALSPARRISLWLVYCAVAAALLRLGRSAMVRGALKIASACRQIAEESL